jgi:ABC-type Fe3+ transport system substrate-binding protein
MKLLVTAFAGAWLGLTTSAFAQTPVPYAADPALVEAARKEGRLIFYTTWIVDQLGRPMAAEFEKRFPGVRVEYVRGDSNQNLMKMLTERKANASQSDVWTLTAGIGELAKAGGVAKLDLPSARDIPERYKDPDGKWIATYSNVHAPAYNTTLVAAKDVPKTYEDLLDPKWKGRLVWKRGDLTGSSGFIANALLTFGEEKGRDYLRRLAQQNVTFSGGSARALMDNVIAGEYPLGLHLINVHAALSAANGAPVKWIAISPVAMSTSTIGITQGSRHPNAAKLFVDFVISRAGQTIMRDLGYLPVHPDVPAQIPELKPENGGFTVNVITPDHIDANQARWAAIENEIFK